MNLFEFTLTNIHIGEGTQNWGCIHCLVPLRANGSHMESYIISLSSLVKFDVTELLFSGHTLLNELADYQVGNFLQNSVVLVLNHVYVHHLRLL